MRLSELDHWCTGGLCDDYTFEVDEPSYRLARFAMPYGDFLRAYLLHLAIPRWKRLFWNAEWRRVEEKMRSALNERADVVWYRRLKA